MVILASEYRNPSHSQKKTADYGEYTSGKLVVLIAHVKIAFISVSNRTMLHLINDLDLDQYRGRLQPSISRY